MKKIIRLTESDLHNLVQRSVAMVLQEQQDNNLLLQSIAQSIAQKGRLDVILGENDTDIELQGGRFANITFEVIGDPYMKRGMRSNSYDVPDDPDEIIDNPTIEVGSIEYCNNDGRCIPIHDNGIVKKALESIIEINYNPLDIPSEEDYYYTEE
jgi:hypothetical protein